MHDVQSWLLLSSLLSDLTVYWTVGICSWWKVDDIQAMHMASFVCFHRTVGMCPVVESSATGVGKLAVETVGLSDFWRITKPSSGNSFLISKSFDEHVWGAWSFGTITDRQYWSTKCAFIPLQLFRTLSDPIVDQFIIHSGRPQSNVIITPCSGLMLATGSIKITHNSSVVK